MAVGCSAAELSSRRDRRFIPYGSLAAVPTTACVPGTCQRSVAARSNLARPPSTSIEVHSFSTSSQVFTVPAGGSGFALAQLATRQHKTLLENRPAIHPPTGCRFPSPSVLRFSRGRGLQIVQRRQFERKLHRTPRGKDMPVFQLVETRACFSTFGSHQLLAAVQRPPTTHLSPGRRIVQPSLLPHRAFRRSSPTAGQHGAPHTRR